MIGLSVSFCIREIAEGVVRLEDVEKIIGSTAFTNSEEMEDVLSTYCESGWLKCQEEARRVFMELWNAGKIEQPKLVESWHTPRISNGIWTDSEANIEWNEKPEWL